MQEIYMQRAQESGHVEFAVEAVVQIVLGAFNAVTGLVGGEKVYQKARLYYRSVHF